MNNQIFFYECAAGGLNTNLVAYYKLDSNVNDSISSQNGTIVGSPTFVSGKVGNAINFINDAALNHFTIADSNNFSFTSGAGVDLPFSISFWVNSAGYSATANFLINKRTISASEWQIVLINGTSLNFIKFQDNTGTNYQGITSATSLSLSTWYHVVVTDNGTKTNAGMKTYLNGVLLSSSNFNSGSYTGMSNTNASTMVGNLGSGAGAALKHRGLLDEVAIWKNRELNQTEITRLYNSGNGITYPF